VLLLVAALSLLMAYPMWMRQHVHAAATRKEVLAKLARSPESIDYDRFAIDIERSVGERVDPTPEAMASWLTEDSRGSDASVSWIVSILLVRNGLLVAAVALRVHLQDRAGRPVPARAG
jgi:hypothetical protein